MFNSLTKDMTGKEDVYRGPAIRALCRITDVIPSLLNSFSSLLQYVKHKYRVFNSFIDLFFCLI